MRRMRFSSAALNGFFFFARAALEVVFFEEVFLLVLVECDALDFRVWETQNGEQIKAATANTNNLDLILTTSV
jgi:hypothetical protein